MELELAVANMVYLGLNSTDVIGSLICDGKAATLTSPLLSALMVLMTLTTPSELPVKMYSPFGVNDASIGM